ncbi:MAG: hypothetical protein CM15mP65_10650 [Crocinitomicaceae bacterium]|nr:MAG: hypothetical protein CM15mP65_10650 [Crocinitomicaceae bacterium]
MASFKERKNIKLNQLSNDVLKIWEEENTFKKVLKIEVKTSLLFFMKVLLLQMVSLVFIT